MSRLAIATLLVLAGSARADTPPELAKPIDEAIAKAPLLGLSVAIAINGKIVVEQGYGFTDLDRKTPITPDTVFEIGSLTKQFTAAAVLTLVDVKQLKLADPVSRYVPEITAAITIEQLLHQTSGLPGYASGFFIGRSYPELVQIIAKFTPAFTPGTKYEYSNTNYFLLSRVVEKVSGHSYADYVRDHVIAKVKLEHTTYCTPTTATARPTTNASGKLALDRHPIDVSFFDGAGALCSTAPDLLRWQDALFGGKVVSAASLAFMTTPALKGTYGAGLIADTVAKHRRIWHNGGIPGGFESQLAWYPDDHLQIVLLTNTMGAQPAITLGSLDRRLARAVLSPSLDKPLDAAGRQPFLGSYALAGVTIEITADGDHLSVKTPTFTDTLLYQGGNVFRLSRKPEGEYRFDVPATGPAQGIDVYLDGDKIVSLKRLQEP